MITVNIRLAGARRPCPHCKRSTWQHKRPDGSTVCRGDVTPSRWPAYGRGLPDSEPGGPVGCGRESRNNGTK